METKFDFVSKLSDEKIAELKTQHNVQSLNCESWDMGDAGELTLLSKPMTRFEYENFVATSGDMDDGAKRIVSMLDILGKCIVYPTMQELDPVFNIKPALLSAMSDRHLSEIGALATATVKKV